MPPEVHAITDTKARVWLAVGLLCTTLLAVITTIVIGAALYGCAAVKTSCDIIHVANDVCHVVAVTNTAGSTVLLPVSEAEIHELAARAAARNGVQLPPQPGVPTSIAPPRASGSATPTPTQLLVVPL